MCRLLDILGQGFPGRELTLHDAICRMHAEALAHNQSSQLYYSYYSTCYIYDYLGGIQNACDGYDFIRCLPAMISLVKRLAYFS